MKNDLKTGIIIGTVLVIGIVLIISLWPGQSVDQRHRDLFQEEEMDLPITTQEDNLPTSTKKTTPIETTQPANPRIHTVTTGETLSAIAMKYYGTTGHAQIILEANKSRITDKNQIRPGMRLIIPRID